MISDQGNCSAPNGISAASTATPAQHIANVPNLLSGIRFVGAFAIVGLALLGLDSYLIPTIVVLMLTDWFDGKIAVRFHQQTAFGARLDSLADVSFYSAALFAMAWLRTELVLAELGWLIPGMAAYLVNCLLGLARFGQVPTYHTRGAKIAWLFSTLAILGVLGARLGWPLRAAGVWVLLVNLEAILITLTLPRCEVDVPSLYHAIKLRRAFLASTSASQVQEHNTPRGP